MIEVSKEVFFQAISGPENINPRPENTYAEWYMYPEICVGKTTPGLKNSYTEDGKAPQKYFLTPKFAKKKGITH